MLKSKAQQPRDPNRPKARVTATGAVRVDSASLLRTPRVQAQLKRLKDLRTASEQRIIADTRMPSAGQSGEQDSKVMQAAEKGMMKYHSTLRELAER